MSRAHRNTSSVLAALSLACSGAGACVFLAPFPDVASDPPDEGGGGGEGAIEEGCVPFSEKRCYSGPDGTRSLGVCAEGLATCNAEGTGYGACVGEVLPSFESCATDADENCDGQGCTGGHIRSVTFGGTGDQRGSAIAVGATQQPVVVMTGSASGAIDLGADSSGELGGSSDPDCFLAQFSATQRLRWSHRFADSISRGVAVTPGGDVVLVGGATGTADFGGGPLIGNDNGEDVFVARFDSAGAHRFSRRFGNGANQFANAVAVDAAGSAVITGGFWGQLDFARAGGEDDEDDEDDEDSGIESSGESDIFVVKLDAEGTLVWAKRFGDGGHHQMGTGVAIDGQGNIVLAGWFGGRTDFGGGEVVSRGEADMFIAKLNSAGDHLWSTTARSTNAARALGVAVDGAGNIFATGSFRSSIRIGDTTHSTEGDKDVFLLKLDDNGVPLWSKRFGDGADQEGAGVAVDPAGGVVLTGFFLGRLDLGVGSLSASGAADGFLAKFGPDGALRWSRSFGDSSEQSGTAVAADLLGDTWATGYFSGGADFGGGAIPSRGASDAFLVQLGP